ncbi:MAG: glycosyltransferase [Bacteroidales bacterium]|nr:glycosyltransferase [Bacteroidales bacterium]
MLTQPSISIITVVYNAKKQLEATVLSILEQTSKDFEYIIIDGGSTDGTLDVIKKYESQIGFWLSEPDNGLYDAMNKGLSHAKGTFVWFLNAGDKIFDMDTVQKLTDIYAKTDADILYGETMVFSEAGNDVGLRRHSAPADLSWKSLKMGMLVCHQSFLPKREIAPYYNLEYSCSSDIDWEINCLKKARRIVNTKLIISRFLDGGRSKKTIFPSLKERFVIMVKNYGLGTTLLNHIRIFFRFFIYYFRHGRF